MSFSTVYDVKVRYSVDNRAGRAVDGLADDTRKLGREVRSTSSAFANLGTVVVGAFGARAAGQALIGFNRTVEDTRLQIAGMLALARKKDLATQFSDADRLFANLQRRAMSLPGTTMEYAKMAGAITQPIIDAGLTLRDLEDLTVNSVVGAKALGVAWEVAARDIDQALRGQFHSVDVFTGKILGSVGYKGEEGRAKYNALAADKRAVELKRALTQPQLEQLAAAQGQTFGGVLSTLQDTFEQVVGKVGLPLFQAVTAEVKRWNAWLDDNKRKVDEIAKSVGDGLVTGFKVVKDALGFLVEHGDTLLTIGKVWAAVKIGGMIGGGSQTLQGHAATAAAAFAPGGFFRGARDSFDPNTGEYKYTPAGRGRAAIGGLKGLASNAGLIGQAALVGMAIGSALGLDKVGSEMGRKIAIWTGNINENYIAWERLQQASAKLKEAMEHAADAAQKTAAYEGAKTRAVTNIQGMGSLYAQAANLLGDRARIMNEAGSAGGHGWGGANFKRYTAPQLDAQSEELVQRAAKKLGITGDLDSMSSEQVASVVADLRYQARALAEKATVVGANAQNQFEVAFASLTDYQKQTLDKQQAMLEVSQLINQAISKGQGWDYGSILDIMRRNTMDPTGKHAPMAEKPRVNVTIQRIEVQSEDPDRMAFGLLESFRDAAKNPSSALATLREG